MMNAAHATAEVVCQYDASKAEKAKLHSSAEFCNIFQDSIVLIIFYWPLNIVSCHYHVYCYAHTVHHNNCNFKL